MTTHKGHQQRACDECADRRRWWRLVVPTLAVLAWVGCAFALGAAIRFVVKVVAQ